MHRAIPLALLALACQPELQTISPTEALALSAEFSKIERQALAAGAESWAAPTHGWVTFSWSATGFPISPGPCGPRHACIVWQEGKPVGIYITPAIRHNPAALYCAVAHELGHGLGLEHSPDPRSIMHDTVTLPCTITPADAQAVINAAGAP